MHIKDVEQRTGLSRANIRYYEQEGLVHPARRKNGYRDYSPDDLETCRMAAATRICPVPPWPLPRLPVWPLWWPSTSAPTS